MLRRLLLLISIPLAGCVVAPPVNQEALPRPASAEQAPSAEAQNAQPSREPDSSPDDLPKIALDEDLLLRFLAGDIAIQRGQAGFAAKTWFDLAQRTRDPRIARRAVELALATGQPPLALEASQIWSESAPQSLTARRLQISLLIRANRLSEVAALIPPQPVAPSSEWGEFFMQLHLLWDRKAERAEVARLTGLLTDGLEKMPEAQFARAVMHATQDREAAALAALDATLVLRPWWEGAVLYKAQLLAQRPKSDAAIVFLRTAVDKNPMQLSFSLMLARALGEAKRASEANAVYRSILVGQPDQVDALVGAGEYALQNRDFSEAFRLLDAAQKRATRNGDLLRFYLGQIEEERMHLQEALVWYRQVAGNEKRQAQLRIPSVLARLGERDAALKALADIPATTEAEILSKAQLEAQLWRVFKEPAKGREVLTRALVVYPEATNLYYDRSLLSELLNDIPAAEADLRRALAQQPGNVMVINALGYVLVSRTDRLAEAETLLDKAIASEPDNPTIIDSVGWLRFRQGRLKEAVEWLVRAHKLMPDPEISAHLVEAFWQSGDKDKAKEAFDSASKLHPQSEELANTRKRLGF